MDTQELARDSEVSRQTPPPSVAGHVRTIATLPRARQLALLVDTFEIWNGRGAARLGAALAYYTLFSIAPLLIIVVAVVGLVLGDEAARGEIAPLLRDLVGPQGAEAVELLLRHAGTPGGGVVATLLGVATVAFGASLAVNELRLALNRIWDVQDAEGESGGVFAGITRLLNDRLFSFLTIVGAALLLVLSVFLNSAVAFAGTYFAAWLPAPELVLQVLNFLLTWSLTTVVFAMIYTRLPDAHVAAADAVIGAMMTAILFGLGGVLISQFLGKATATTYGSAGSVLALLTWLYYSTLVFLFGAAFTGVFAQRYGSGIVPHRRRVKVRLPARRRGAHP